MHSNRLKLKVVWLVLGFVAHRLARCEWEQQHERLFVHDAYIKLLCDLLFLVCFASIVRLESPVTVVDPVVLERDDSLSVHEDALPQQALDERQR